MLHRIGSNILHSTTVPRNQMEETINAGASKTTIWKLFHPRNDGKARNTINNTNNHHQSSPKTDSTESHYQDRVK